MQEALQVTNLQNWLENYLKVFQLALLAGLKSAPRFWLGPHSYKLSDLQRCCGPEETMEYHMRPEDWERRVGKMVTSFRKLEDFPPLIVEYRKDILSVRDGNTRHETFRRLGIPLCLALVWFNNLEDAVVHSGTPEGIICLWPQGTGRNEFERP